MAKKSNKKFKNAQKAKKPEQAKESESKETEQKQEMEQTIWSVRVGSQTLYKTFREGRTRLDGMSAEENEKVGEVLSEALDAVARILEDRTTQHPIKKEEITEIKTE